MSSIISKQMCSENVQSEIPRAFQEPASTSGEDIVRANSTVVVNASSSQQSLNATGIASLFSGAKFENSTVNINFPTDSKSSFK